MIAEHVVGESESWIEVPYRRVGFECMRNAGVSGIVHRIDDVVQVLRAQPSPGGTAVQIANRPFIETSVQCGFEPRTPNGGAVLTAASQPGVARFARSPLANFLARLWRAKSQPGRVAGILARCGA